MCCTELGRTFIMSGATSAVGPDRRSPLWRWQYLIFNSTSKRLPQCPFRPLTFAPYHHVTHKNCVCQSLIIVAVYPINNLELVSLNTLCGVRNITSAYRPACRCNSGWFVYHSVCGLTELICHQWALLSTNRKPSRRTKSLAPPLTLQPRSLPIF